MARGSIVQRPSGNYAIVYRVNGTQKWETAGRTKRQAERLLAERMGEIHSGTYRELKDATFEEFAAKWLADYAKPRVKSSTYASYEITLNVHLIPAFGKTKLTAITTEAIEAFLARKQRETNLSAVRIGYCVVLLKMVLKRAVIWRYLKENPAEYVEKPRVQRKEQDFLAPAEARRLLETVQRVDPDYYALFATALLTGMRQGELRALKWSDIDWKTGRVYVRRSAVGNELQEPKSAAGIRVLSVGPQLLHVLKRHQLRCPVSELDLVFPNEAGGILDPRNLVRRHFEPALTQAGLRKVRFHDLRHSNLTHAMRALNGDVMAVKAWAGHASAQVTMQYQHAAPPCPGEVSIGARLEEELLKPSKQPVSRVLAEASESAITPLHADTEHPGIPA